MVIIIFLHSLLLLVLIMTKSYCKSQLMEMLNTKLKKAIESNLLSKNFVEHVEKEEKKLEEDFKSVIKEMDRGIGDVVSDLPVSFNKNNIIAAIVNYCRRIYVFMDSVESFIDDLFSYGTFGEYSSYVLKEEPEDFHLFGNEDVVDD